MRALILSIILGLFSSQLSAKDFYKVNLTRKGKDLYEDQTTHVKFITKRCYEYVHFDDSIYRDNGKYDQEIIFSDGSKCDVEDVVR